MLAFKKPVAEVLYLVSFKHAGLGQEEAEHTFALVGGGGRLRVYLHGLSLVGSHTPPSMSHGLLGLLKTPE